MERIFDNVAKTALIFKLFVWAFITLLGAFVMALPGVFSQSKTQPLKKDLLAEDPYTSNDGDAANSRALRYL